MMFDDIAGMEPIRRLNSAVDSLDNRAAEILTLHAAIERELDLAISRQMPHPERLHGLGFGHKVGLWAGLNDKPDDHVSKLTVVLLRLNDLRNCIAHGDSGQKIDASVKRLYDTIPKVTTLPISLKFVGAFILGFLHPMTKEEFAKFQLAVKERTALLMSGE